MQNPGRVVFYKATRFCLAVSQIAALINSSFQFALRTL
jgi:hypothetical protein